MSGSLETVSLPELFRLIDLSTKTGRLTVQPLVDENTPCAIRVGKARPRDVALPKEIGSAAAQKTIALCYIWFEKGRLVAITDDANRQRLIDLIENRGWLGRRVIEKLADLCPAEYPFGLYLKTMGVLKAEQLQLLFQMNLHQVYKLFEVTSGWFMFEVLSSDKTTNNLATPWLEMTGNSMRATEVTLFALRLVKNWTGFFDKLPDLNSALRPLVRQVPFRLDTQELELWQLADEITSLDEMAFKLKRASDSIQKTAFRLIITGLVEEVFQDLPTNGMPAQFLQPKPLSPAVIAQEAASKTIGQSPRYANANREKPVTISANPDSNFGKSPDTSGSIIKNLISFLRNNGNSSRIEIINSFPL
ncbi:MAG: DUF4388 domain-containing protein [Hydrococcus sp. CRU_1_1]|nr:DUF4388 domain-containing protein [Hydrococcus sp. CRU_1_1]